MRKGYLDTVIPALRKIVTYHNEVITLDFSNVIDITKGSYMVLLAQAEKALERGKKVRLLYTVLPPEKVLNILHSQSKYIYKKYNKEKKRSTQILHERFDVTANALPNAEFDRTVDTQMIEGLVLELRSLGVNEFYQPFYDFLVELIGNATEHGIKNKNINWWLLRYRDKKRVKYVFVDMGVGIIKSYKKSGMLKEYTLRDPKKIPIDVLYGRIGSSTKQDGRGRGLPQIKDIVEKDFVSDFVMITNNVSLRYINGGFEVDLNPNFVGTYYSWSISKENFVKWKNLR